MALPDSSPQPGGVGVQLQSHQPQDSQPLDGSNLQTASAPAAHESTGRAAQRPTGLLIPRLSQTGFSALPVSQTAPWSQMAESNALNEDAASVVGISIGREQTRMTSPSTPAAEKSAALDRVNSWGFFDNTVHEQEQLAEIKEDDPELESAAEESPQKELPLPSPWVSGPRVHETDKDRNRQRTGSLFNATLPDISINPRQIWQNFNASSLTDALHKLAPLSTFKDGQTVEKRPGRSNSLFANRMSWGGMGRKDGNSSPKATGSSATSAQPTPTVRQSPFGDQARSLVPSPKSESPERRGTRNEGLGLRNQAAQQPTYAPVAGSDSMTKDDLRTSSDASARPRLRRVNSDGSMISKASTKYSFDADRDKFADIDTMVNSRFKAVKDSWQDSAFRLKNVTSNRRISFRPDFLKSADDAGLTKARTTTAGMGSVADAGKSGASEEVHRTQSEPVPGSPTLSRHPTLDKALDQLTGDLVLMGGYRGSILRSAEPPHKQVWVPVKVGLNIRKVNLEMGLEPEDEETEHERIFSSGILSHIGPIDISRRLIRRIKSSANRRAGSLRFHDYGYDWRLSPELLAKQLIKFLESLPCNQPGVHPSRRGATVIAHSLGGLLTRWAVNHRPELFAGVIYAGTPQHCVNILGPFRNGDDVLLSSRVLTAQVNFTLRTSFALLPESGRCFIDKNTGEEYRVDFFDAKQWEANRWSPCVGYPLPALESKATRSSLLSTLRDSVPSLPSLGVRSESNSNTNLAGPSSGSPSPTRHPSSDEETTKKQNITSPLRATANAVDRTAADLAHPNQNTVNPSMSQPPAATSVATAVTIPHGKAMEYLTRTLADTLRFKRALAHRPELEHDNAYPPLAVLYATCVPTVYGAKVAGRDGMKRADAYDNLVFAAGDGVVLARASMLPRGYKLADGGRVRTDRGHVGLLGDLEAVGQCLVSVIEARRKGIGTGKEV